MKEDGARTIASLLPLSNGDSLRLVTEYRHLGVVTTAVPAAHRELAERARAANLATAALSAAVFRRRRKMPTAVRVMVAQACVNSRALFGAGTWATLSASQARRVSAAIGRPRSIIATSTLSAASHPSDQLSHRASAWTLGLPPPSASVHAARLRYAARFSASAPASPFRPCTVSGRLRVEGGPCR